MASGDTKTEQMLNVLANGGDASQFSGCCNTKTQNYILGAIDRVQSVEDEVEELKNNPDVVDIVDTYADLQAYDTSTLTDKDIIRVLEDSTHDNGSTYYRWNATTNQFDYIGEAGGGGPTVVQTTGNSTTDVMSQDAVTKMVYNSPSQLDRIRIGENAQVTSGSTVAIGDSARVNAPVSVAIGYDAHAGAADSVALGSYSETTKYGQVHIGVTNSNHGYNNSYYRLLSGVYDPVDAHDAATKGYVDANASTATFYMSVSPYVNNSGVSLYSDIALTTAVPASTFVQALRNCKSVFLVHKLGDSDWSERRIVQIISSHVPNADTAEAYDEVFPIGYYFDGSSGDRCMIQSATSDPDDTASFRIARYT